MDEWIEFRKYFDKFVVQDIKKALNADVQVGILILAINGMEVLGGYYTGTKGDRDPFVKFIEKFMPGYSEYADSMYTCVRNGLFHDYRIKIDQEGKTFLLTGKLGEEHLTFHPENQNIIFINREEFANDFLVAQQNYFDAVEKDPKLMANALKRIKARRFLTVRPSVQWADNPPKPDEIKYRNYTGTSVVPPPYLENED